MPGLACATPPRRGGSSPVSTASSIPTMGWIPAPDIFSENSSAPNRLFVSVSAKAGMWSLSASFFSSSMRSDPSSKEKDEWTCRCTNPTSRRMQLTRRLSEGRTIISVGRSGVQSARRAAWGQSALCCERAGPEQDRGHECAYRGKFRGVDDEGSKHDVVLRVCSMNLLCSIFVLNFKHDFAQRMITAAQG